MPATSRSRALDRHVATFARGAPAAAVAAIVAAAWVAAAPAGAFAQDAPPPQSPAAAQTPETTQAASAATPRLPRTVVAANLAGALVGVTSLEAERVITPNLGLGAGVTHWSLLSDQLFAYTSADARLRFYTSGAAPTGVSLAVVGGGARVTSRTLGQTYSALGAGVEVSYSELAGRERRLYLAVGAGAKRLFPLGANVRTALRGLDLSYPTVRAAIGWGF